MIRMFVRHQVRDYDAWRVYYDDFEPQQKEAGVTAEAVYCSVDDPNDVTVTHDFATIDQAQAFVQNPLLKEALEKAGVVGAPDIWFAEER